MEFAIDGKVMGKGRPRFARQGNFVRTYTPDTTVEYEEWARLCYKQASKQFVGSKPVRMHVRAYYDIPKSYTKGRRLACEHNVERPMKKPDWDNIGKIISDALNKAAYEDDKQIVDGRVTKWYTTKEPKVVVSIEEIDTTKEQWTDKEQGE